MRPNPPEFHQNPIVTATSKIVVTNSIQSPKLKCMATHMDFMCTHTIELRSVTLWDHSVTCHSKLPNSPRLNPSQAGRYLIYLPLRDGRLS